MNQMLRTITLNTFLCIPILFDLAAGSCLDAGYTQCCEAGCTGNSSTICYCDLTCYVSNDCCPDIAMTCPEPVTVCPALTAPMNGAVSYSPDMIPDFNIDTIATFTCDAGFSLNGAQATLRCTQLNIFGDATWSGAEPSCLLIECSPLTAPRNGIISYTMDTTSHIEINTVATFTCDAGYSLNGAITSLTCTDDDQADTIGVWGGSVPACQSIECSPLTTPQNGRISYTDEGKLNLGTDTVAIFSCDAGFSLNGAPSNLTCVDDDQADTIGLWNGTEPICQVIECLPLTAPLNGDVSYVPDETPNFDIGTVAIFTCDAGFSSNGAPALLRCFDVDQVDTIGSWSGTEPSCPPIECPALSAPLNANISYSTNMTSLFEIGTVVTFACHAGFSLNGAPANLTCADDDQADIIGTWGGTEPTCPSIECPRLATPWNGKVFYTMGITSNFIIGTTATFICNTGFSLNGAIANLTCFDDDQADTIGIWDGSEPSCPAIGCFFLTPPLNGAVSYSTMNISSKFLLGTVATFTCDANFSLNGSIYNLACFDDDQADTIGIWNGTEPTCLPIECTPLSTPLNGNIFYTMNGAPNFKIGTVVTFTCDAGFSLNGAKNNLICADDDQADTNGTWNGFEPTCQLIECAPLIGPANGVVLYSKDPTPKFEIGTIATFVCNLGFFFDVTPANLTCSDDDQADINGTWGNTEPPPDCFFVDPCASDPCHVNATCERVALSSRRFTCKCNFGLFGNGDNCTDQEPVEPAESYLIYIYALSPVAGVILCLLCGVMYGHLRTLAQLVRLKKKRVKDSPDTVKLL